MSRRHDTLGVGDVLRRIRRVGLVLAFAAGGLVSAGEVSAQTVRLYATYSSQDQAYHGPIMLPPDASTTIHFWLEGGAATSATPCQPGATGDEVCAYDFAITAESSFVLSNYNGDASFDGSGSVGSPPAFLGPDPGNPGNQLLASNGFDLGTPVVANRHLGSVVVTTGSEIAVDHEIDVTGKIVGADLAMGTIESRSIIVPEPLVAPGLGLGILLGAASGRRARRVKVPDTEG